MRFLIVEDSNSIRKIIKKTLQRMEFEDKSPTISEAINGKQAWQKMQDACRDNELPDLILCDWNMPGMSGLELVKDLREEEACKNIPIIMITTVGEKSKVIKAIQAGINNYLLKPFEEEDLKFKIFETLKCVVPGV
ncbi:response regulator [Candidatus Riflebacteria bacterium]